MASSVCIGRFEGAHGVRGQVRVRSYCADPADITAYGPLTDAEGRRAFTLRLVGEVRGNWIAVVSGITNREQAQALNGVDLFVDRAKLPAVEEDEYLHADLVGLTAEDPAGLPLGRVVAVHDFGGGEMLEVRRAEPPSVMVPFTRAAVPTVDLAGGRLVVDLPDDWFTPITDKARPRPPEAPTEHAP